MGTGRPSQPPPANVHPLVRLILAQRIARKLTWTALTKRTGISKSTVYSWKRRRSTPNLFVIEAVLNALGYDLAAVPRGTTPKGD